MFKTSGSRARGLFALPLTMALLFGGGAALAEPARASLPQAVCMIDPPNTYGRCYNNTDCSRICSDWAGTWVQGTCAGGCCYCP